MKSSFLTFQRCFASPIATKFTTDDITMVANTNFGSLRMKLGKMTNASMTKRPVTKPAKGVFAPVELATAEREKEPATGYPAAKLPIKFASPMAPSSFPAESSSPCFAAMDLPIAIDSMKPINAAEIAVSKTVDAFDGTSLKTRGRVKGGNPEGTNPMVCTP